MTKSVKALLTEFDKDSNAIAATELIQRLGKDFNKTTIYRVLDKLEDDGLLHSFLGKNGTKWYAKCTGCSSKAHQDMHPHFQCLSCGKVDCLEVEVLLPNIPNRKVFHSHLLIQGTCSLCL